MLMQMVEILGPILVITMIGYIMGRSSIGLEMRSLSTVVILVATPSLIFHTLTSLHVTTETLGQMASAAFLCLALAGIMGFIILLIAGARDKERSFLPPLMLPNSGNMGLPLVMLAFGPEGTQLGVAYFFIVALVQNTVGLSIYAGSVRLKELARQPLVYSVAAVLIVTWFDLPVPTIVSTTTQMLGGMMIPAMLLLLGTSLASLKVADLRPALFVAFGRLGIGLVSAVITIYVLDLQGTAAGIVFLLATMPTAIISYVFAERYQRDARQVAGSVVVSTLLTFACLPVLVWTALEIAKAGMPTVSEVVQ